MNDRVVFGCGLSGRGISVRGAMDRIWKLVLVVADTLHADLWKQICPSGLGIEYTTIRRNTRGYS